MMDPGVEIEDEDFLSQVAAAEAQALSSKRRKITTTTAAAANTPTSATSSSAESEGIYTAALRGSRSHLFQHQTTTVGSNTRIRANGNRNVFAAPESGGGGVGGGGGGEGGLCFKCGKLGHWARDCGESGSNPRGLGDDPSVQEKAACPCGLGTCLVLTANTEKNLGRRFYKCPARQENGGCGFFEWCDKNEGTNNPGFRSQSHASNPSFPDLSSRDCGDSGLNSRGLGNDPSVQEKACPCGLGTCLVLTANTEKNLGRKFYKCPARQENGGCGFFEWCDKNEGTNNLGFRSQSHASNPSFQDLSCPCGAGYCLILTAKTGKNIGQAFYKCPANQGSSCGFFKWCHDQTTNSSPASVKTSIVHKTTEMGNKNYATKGGSPCFKCGQDGHWAKDCAARPPIQNPTIRARSYHA